MGITDIPYKAFKKYRNDGLVNLLNSSQSYLRRHTRTYFDEVIVSRILWGDFQFRSYTYWRLWFHQQRFFAPANPLHTIMVNPQEIELYNSEIEKKWGLGQIISGDWDREICCKPLTKNSIFTGLRQRFMEGLEWEETDYYKKAQLEFQKGRSMWGYEDLDQFRDVRCRYVDDLYKSIKQNGYRPNRTGKHKVPGADTHRKETAYIHRLEPLVVIGRDGTIYWRDGHHRTAIVQILGIDELPVQVLCRHQHWQAIRDKVARASKGHRCEQMDKKSLKDHPDLRDVI